MQVEGGGESGLSGKVWGGWQGQGSVRCGPCAERVALPVVVEVVAGGVGQLIGHVEVAVTAAQGQTHTHTHTHT